jgi:pyrroline-5-carboxylate reductase
VRTTVFLGGGRITGALIAGLRLAKFDQPIVVHDRHPKKLRDLERQYGIKPEANLHRATEQADLLIIAVRPDSVRDLLCEVGRVNHRITAVSLAAGVPLSKLRNALGYSVRWARAMPSPVCRVGRGLTAVTFDRGLPLAERRAIKTFFTRVGSVLEIRESKFDVFTATYSCSHGYHALAALAAAGQSHGLDRKTALTAAAHALADGIIAWRDRNIPLDRLLHEAATPGGIAATTMTAMDEAGHGKAVARGLRAGIERARQHGKR